MYECKWCGRKSESKHGSKYHENRCFKNPNPAKPKPKSKKWLKAMKNRKGKGANQWTKNPNYEMSDATREKLSEANKGRKHSEETKKKISESRKKYLEDNPDQVPYILNHYSKGESYPEKYFREVLENNSIEYIQEHRCGLYSMDFAIPSKMIDLEIDGEQHYVDNRVVNSDEKRNDYIKNEGWKTIRVRWSEYQRLPLLEKKEYVCKLIDLLK